jgi:hypothetical protein
MHNGRLAGRFLVICLLATGRASAAADDATLFRVFLTDGSSLVSYGEFARVEDRVVFSMPTSATPNPPLHLVNIPADRVDWDRTNRYAASARAAHYIETRAEIDYAALSTDIVQTLNDVAHTTDPARRLAIVERARKALAEWPPNHFNYRSTEVRQMLTMLDEAIADLQAAGGGDRFDLNFSAFVDPPPIVEPLAPPLTPREAIEQTLAAAMLSDTSAERMSLLAVALADLEHGEAELPEEWASATRTATKAQIDAELELDHQYQTLTKRMLRLADQRSRMADVRGLERLLNRIHESDAALGLKRPDAVVALVQAVEVRLDATRQLRLARDRWAMRAPDFRRYRASMSAPFDLFARLRPALEDIKALAGSTTASLLGVQRDAAQIVSHANAIVPPDELKSAHALLVSAAQLASNAARIRWEATLAGNLARAWDASSAAAGALMLGARARTDIQALLRPPPLQ